MCIYHRMEGSKNSLIKGDKKGQNKAAGVKEARSTTNQNISLTDLIWCLLQSSLRSVNPSIALVNVLLQIPNVVVFEAVSRLLPLS